MLKDYNITGLPTKLVLDGNGNIRFKSVGFEGSNESSMDEISAMIDIITKSDK